MEHPDYDNHTPLVAGVWNMQKFTCSPDVGITYFMDSRDVYEKLFSEEEKSFLRQAEASWVETYSEDKEITNTVKVVARHWIDGRELMRFMHQLPSVKLFKIDGQDPTKDQEAFFKELVLKFVHEVSENTDLRIAHRWQQGDILIPDLNTMAHAVTGGFSPEEREFTGYWCFLNIEEAIKNGAVHPSWI
jgi:alpha-ketoglutarate-dependent taurine dioxygenase